MSYSQRHELGAPRGSSVTTAADAPTAAELAARYGLAPSSARPPFTVYVRQLWQRRHFITSFATSRATSMSSGARLGQLWQLLTPLMNAAVYYFIFGVLFNSAKHIPNFIAFL